MIACLTDSKCKFTLTMLTGASDTKGISLFVVRTGNLHPRVFSTFDVGKWLMRARNAYRQWHGDETEQKVGNGKVHDEDVAGGAHCRLAGDHVNDERIAHGADDDQQTIGADEAEERGVAHSPIGRKSLNQCEVEARVWAVAAAGRTP